MAVLGLNAKLYRNTATWATPTWDEVTGIRDVGINVSKALADVSARGGGGFRQQVATLKEGEITFQQVWSSADADFIAFEQAWELNTTIDCWALDGDSTTSGNAGLRAEFEVSGFDIGQELENAILVDVTLVIGSTANTPEWKTVP